MGDCSEVTKTLCGRKPKCSSRCLKKKKISAWQAASSHSQRDLRKSGRSRIIAATGAAQFEFLEVLTKAADIDWRRVEVFHLDE